MSEPITRRKILVDYRIRVSRCEICGRRYFPPKPFCDVEGRRSRIRYEDYFYRKGLFYSGAVIRRPTNRFSYLGSFISCIVEFDGGVRTPGRITDIVPDEGEVDVSEFIGREVVPRFRRTYVDGESGLIYYSSLAFSFADDYYEYREYKPVKPSEGSEKPGIVGYGVYIPKFRVKNANPAMGGGVVERAVPFPDEDATTFAVEAGRRALIHSALDSRYIGKCYIGSESTPYAVKPSASTVIQALELGEPYEDGFFTGGLDTQFACKAATDLFIDAVALVSCPLFKADYVMVIGADNSQAAPGDPLDYTVGAGAAAYIFGKRDVIATLDHYVSYTSDTPDFYRRDGEKYPRHGGRFTGEPAYFKHVTTAMKTILRRSGLKPGDISYVALHSPNIKYPVRAALSVGFTMDQIRPGLVNRYLGNLYSGSSPTALAAILDIAEPGDRVLLVSYGSGAGSDAYIFTVTEKVEEKRDRAVSVRSQIENPKRRYVDYATYRKWKEASSV
ncbi:MAG: Hydroxymethylglutaryl-CoA synthase [Candidatus Bathyarchaeota archaeon B24]|nr:MAG: Hydroxymethylglutaryl-CoA synthase [Candidatus Bathyarchaeota archaeon B24]